MPFSLILLGGVGYYSYQTGEIYFLAFGMLLLACIDVISAVSQSRKTEVKHDKKFLQLGGRQGVVVEQCIPKGKVKIGMELWNAMSCNGQLLEKGTRIEVVERDGLLLKVRSMSR